MGNACRLKIFFPQNTHNFSLSAVAPLLQNLHLTQNYEGSLVDSSGREKAAVGGGGGEG